MRVKINDQRKYKDGVAIKDCDSCWYEDSYFYMTPIYLNGCRNNIFIEPNDMKKPPGNYDVVYYMLTIDKDNGDISMHTYHADKVSYKITDKDLKLELNIKSNINCWKVSDCSEE